MKLCASISLETQLFLETRFSHTQLINQEHYRGYKEFSKNKVFLKNYFNLVGDQELF